MLQLWPSSVPEIYVSELVMSDVDRNVEMATVTDEVALPSAGVDCMLQDVRNLRNIFENRREYMVGKGNRTLDGREHCHKF